MEYISFLDAERLWKPEKLEETQVNFLQTNNIPFTFACKCINEEGKSLNITIQAPKNLSYKTIVLLQLCGQSQIYL
jgi:hypothetical protein